MLRSGRTTRSASCVKAAAVIACLSGCTFDGTGIELKDPPTVPPTHGESESQPATSSLTDAGPSETDIGPAAFPDADAAAGLPDSAVARIDAQPAPGPYVDHFATQTSLEENNSDEWRIDAGELALQSCSSQVAHAWVRDTSWTDVRATARVRIDRSCDEGQIGLRIRVAGVDPCRMYVCVIDLSQGSLAIARKGNTCGRALADAETPVEGLATHTWYTLEASAAGGTITCSVSGTGLQPTSVSYVDATGDPIVGGSVGLGGYGVEGRFDDLEVQPLP